VQLTFLGTAAAEGYPNAFCACDNCESARARGGRNIRRRSSALIDRQFLIDLGPDLQSASASLGIPLTGIRYAAQTHEHIDHLEPGNFFSRSDLVGLPNKVPMEWLATVGALDRASRTFDGFQPGQSFADAAVQERFNVRHTPISPYEERQLGPYRVFAVPANHATNIVPLLYAIERDGRQLFYATDTTTLPSEVWEALRERNWRFDVVAMDHTFGTTDRSSGHLNATEFRRHLAAMRELGLLAEDVRVYATHLAHHSNPPHEELVVLTTPHGYDVAWDGLTVDV
jgi:phosphoribosyl 1,2-cyclic phosphate phosphodiesterase